ncbi:hypothetical protein ACFLZ7_01835 [Nanoarchaeota archaeon]
MIRKIVFVLLLAGLILVPSLVIAQELSEDDARRIVYDAFLAILDERSKGMSEKEKDRIEQDIRPDLYDLVLDAYDEKYSEEKINAEVVKICEAKGLKKSFCETEVIGKSKLLSTQNMLIGGGGVIGIVAIVFFVMFLKKRKKTEEKLTIKERLAKFAGIFSRKKKEIVKFEQLIAKLAEYEQRIKQNIVIAKKIADEDIASLKDVGGEFLKNDYSTLIKTHLGNLENLYAVMKNLLNIAVDYSGDSTTTLEKTKDQLIAEIEDITKKAGAKLLSQEKIEKLKKLKRLDEEELNELNEAVQAIKDFDHAIAQFREEVLEKQIELIIEEKKETNLLDAAVKKRNNKKIEATRTKVLSLAEKIKETFDKLRSEDEPLALFHELKERRRSWEKESRELLDAEREREQAKKEIEEESGGSGSALTLLSVLALEIVRAHKSKNIEKFNDLMDKLHDRNQGSERGMALDLKAGKLDKDTANILVERFMSQKKGD